MREISRVEKTNSGFFTTNKLKKKGKIIKRGIDVKNVLTQLQSIGLVSQGNPSKEKWVVTKIGKLVEHELEKQYNENNLRELSRVLRR